jgi:hypothetical protein
MRVNKTPVLVATGLAAAVLSAAPAHADAVLSGHWIENTVINGKPTTNDWYFTSCGAGCAHDEDGATATLQGGYWVVDDTVGTICDDGSGVENVIRAHYSFSASTGAGTVRETFIKAACGNTSGGSQTRDVSFHQA